MVHRMELKSILMCGQVLLLLPRNGQTFTLTTKYQIARGRQRSVSAFQTPIRLFGNLDGSNHDVPESASVEATARSLKEKAEALRKEASLAAVELKAGKKSAKKRKYEQADAFIQEIKDVLDFNRPIRQSGGAEAYWSEKMKEEIVESDKQAVYEKIKSQEQLPSTKLLLLVAEQIFERREECLKNLRELEMIRDERPSSDPSSFNIGDVFNQREEKVKKVDDNTAKYGVEIVQCMTMWDYIVRAVEKIGAEDEEEFGMSLDSSLYRVDESSDVKAYVSQQKGKDFTSIAKELRAKERELMMESIADSARRVAAGINEKAEKESDPPVGSFVDQTLGLSGKNIESGKENNVTSSAIYDFIALPKWVPRSLGGLVVTSGRKIEQSDLKLLKEEVLDGSRFYVSSKDSTKLVAIYRGHTQPSRMSVPKKSESYGEESSSEEIFSELIERLDSAPNNLSDRVQIFLYDDPEYSPKIDYGGSQKVIIAASKSVQPEQGELRGITGTALAAVSTILSFVGVLSYSLLSFALNEELYDPSTGDLKSIFVQGTFEISGGIIALQLLHELSHWIMSKHLNMKIGLPVPIPSLQIGLLGTITPLRSFPQSRTELFDFALAGPATTFFISLIAYMYGLFLTVNASVDSIPFFPVWPATIFKSSFLIGSMTSILASKIMLLPTGAPVPIHPLCTIAEVGLVSSALNMLPIGRTDGGRASTSVFGDKSAQALSLATFFLMAIVCLTKRSVLLIFWGLFTLLFQRTPEIPSRDTVTEVNNGRFILYCVMLVLSILTLVPFPGGLAM